MAPSLNDLARLFYQRATGWTDSLQNPPVGGGGLPVVQTPFEANSVGTSGATSVDHTAGMVVASLAAPPAGLYKIWIQVASAGGTITANDMKNIEFRVGATSVLRPLTMLADSVGTIEAQYRFNGTDGCSVNCIGAGSAGARVAASITLTKIAT